MSQDLAQIRSDLKQQRAQLDEKYIADSAAKFAESFWQLNCTKRATRIALYFPARGELDCTPLIDAAWLRKKRVFLPVVQKNSLKFAALMPRTKLANNRFNILEPVYKKGSLIDARQLDIVITPLVAFDANLNRLGMGGGYYDRSMAFSKRLKNWRHPRLIGAAYSFQQVHDIQAQAWDVPLHCVITEKECFGSC